MGISGSYVERYIAGEVEAGLASARVVGLFGPRQSGKTTMLKRIAGSGPGRKYFTLDSARTLESIRSDPDDFVERNRTAIVDEAHLLPQLVRSIKASVDGDQAPGRYIISSSMSPEAMAHVSDSLVGRMRVVGMLPLSQAEIRSLRPTFLEMLAAGEVPAPADVGMQEFHGCVSAGGYPRAALAGSDRERRGELADLLGLLDREDYLAEAFDMRRFYSSTMLGALRLLAEQAGGLLSANKLHARLRCARPTAEKFVRALSRMRLVALVPRHADSEGRRLSLQPKVEFVDSGILSTLLEFPGGHGGKEAGAPWGRDGKAAVLAETFVYSELLKQKGFMGLPTEIECYRDAAGHEVDFIVTLADGSLLAFEVKTGLRLRKTDFSNLVKFARMKGRRLRLGAVLYSGREIVDIDRHVDGELRGRLLALPLSCLFSDRAR